MPEMTSELNDVLTFFGISSAKHAVWVEWEKKESKNLENLCNLYRHVELCDSWLKDEPKFYFCDKITQLMIYMCVNPMCNCEK